MPNPSVGQRGDPHFDRKLLAVSTKIARLQGELQAALRERADLLARLRESNNNAKEAS